MDYTYFAYINCGAAQMKLVRMCYIQIFFIPKLKKLSLSPVKTLYTYEVCSIFTGVFILLTKNLLIRLH